MLFINHPRWGFPRGQPVANRGQPAAATATEQGRDPEGACLIDGLEEEAGILRWSVVSMWWMLGTVG